MATEGGAAEEIHLKRGDSPMEVVKEFAEKHGYENYASADFDLCAFSRWEVENNINIGVALELRKFLFGKHAGRTFVSVVEDDLQYMQWILDQGRMFADDEYIKGSRMSEFRCAAVAISRLHEAGELVIEAPAPIEWTPGFSPLKC